MVRQNVLMMRTQTRYGVVRGGYGMVREEREKREMFSLVEMIVIEGSSFVFRS